jgi:hypothetical protein
MRQTQQLKHQRTLPARKFIPAIRHRILPFDIGVHKRRAA